MRSSEIRSRHKQPKPGFLNQYIMFHQRTGRFPLVHSSVLFLWTFFYISLLSLFSCRAFLTLDLFVLYSFCIALWSSCIISRFHFFHVAFFHMATFSVALFTCYTFFILHKFHVAFFFSCCTFFTLHIFCVIFFLW